MRGVRTDGGGAPASRRFRFRPVPCRVLVRIEIAVTYVKAVDSVRCTVTTARPPPCEGCCTAATQAARSGFPVGGPYYLPPARPCRGEGNRPGRRRRRRRRGRDRGSGRRRADAPYGHPYRPPAGFRTLPAALAAATSRRRRRWNLPARRGLRLQLASASAAPSSAPFISLVLYINTWRRRRGRKLRMHIGAHACPSASSGSARKMWCRNSEARSTLQ
jgi:hypothetical protein